MSIKLIPRAVLPLLILMFVSAIGCGGEEPEPPTNSAGAGGEDASGGSGGLGGSGGSGGSGEGGEGGTGGTGGTGGSQVECEEDCSAIDTGSCEVAVCNDGSHDGPAGTCVVIAAPNGTVCDDGLFCTVGDVCVEGECIAPATNDCGMDGTQCTTIVCNEDTNSCNEVPANEGSSCDDGLFCTVGDSCVAGACSSTEANHCGMDGTQCTAISCDEGTESCSEIPAHEGDSCDDGFFCTVGDSCVAGACTSTETNDCGMDGTQCTAISCDEGTESCSEIPAHEGDSCDDGLFCTLGDSCVEGACVAPGVNDCGMTGSECTEIACNEDTRGCTEVPANEGDSCDDGLFCTVGDACLAGVCTPTAANDCGLSATACTSIACNEDSAGCEPIPANEGGGCDDGLFCTVGDSCVAGACTPSGLNDCGMAGSECAAVVCNEETESCGDVPVNEGNACDSGTGDLCAVALCTSGACMEEPMDCSSAGTACGDGVCNPESGSCETVLFAAGTSCQDGNGCISGVCQASGACLPTQIADDGSMCNASARCPTDGLCLDGSCYESDECRTALVEDFSGCPAGWLATGDWACGTPTSGPGAALSGTECFATNLAGDYSPLQHFGTAYLQTPVLDLTQLNDPVLSVWAWMSTEANWDGWNIKISTDGGETFELVETVSPAYSMLSNSGTVGAGELAWSGNSLQQEWQMFSADLSQWSQHQAIIRFDFRADGTTQRAGIYLDDFSIAERSTLPLQIAEPEVLRASAGSFLASQMVWTGGDTASWSVVDGENHEWLSINPATGLLGGLPTDADRGTGTITLRVSELSAPWNNAEIEVDFLVLAAAYHQDDFETCSGWTFAPASPRAGDWACGVPTTGPGAARSGQNVLATGLAANYESSMGIATHYARSPTINLVGASEPVLTFWAWAYTENNYDGLNVRVSTDGGVNFVNTVALDPPYRLLTGTTDQAWSGDRRADGWALYSIDLSLWAEQEVVLQFGFRSDGSGQNPGFYIDDLRIGHASETQIEITSLGLDTAFLERNYSLPVLRSGGSAGAVWEIVGGTGHEWLSIDEQTGVLHGMPTALGPVTITVLITEPTEPWNRAEKEFTFEVHPTPIFVDGFETCTGWTFAPATPGAGDWACGVPTSGPNGAPFGQRVLATGLAANYGLNMRFETHYALSPVIDLTSASEPVLVFLAWLDSEASWDGANVKVTRDGGATLELADRASPAYAMLSGTGGELAWSGRRAGLGWQPYSIDLSAWEGELIQLQFGFKSDGSSTYAGIYIDDLRVVQASKIPLRITTGSLPDMPLGAPADVVLERNGGSSAARWSIVSGTDHSWLSIHQSTGALSGTPGFTGSVTVTVRVEEPLEPWNFAEKTLEFDVSEAPLFYDAFGLCDWSMTGIWECGVPTSGPRVVRHGTNALATVLDGTYPSNQVWGDSTATSPPIDLMGATQATLHFRAWLQTESCCDGFNVKVSTDGGETFEVPPAIAPAYLSNSGTPAQPSWRSADGLWTDYSVDLSDYVGEQILLRFDFRSDGSSVADGVYIDRVVITD